MDPRSAGELELAPGCRPLALRLERFVDGGPSPTPAERAHARACAACGARYRAAVERAARPARRARAAAAHAPARAPARTPGPERSPARLGLLGFPRPTSARGSFLRLLLGPALLVLFATRMSGALAHPESLSLSSLAGEVLLDGTLLEPAHALRVSRGTRVHVAPDARARLADDACALELEGATELLVERVWPPRLRMARGELVARGPLVVTHALGVLESEHGRARVRASSAELELCCEAGRVSWTDAQGTRTLALGERLLLGASAVAPPVD